MPAKKLEKITATVADGPPLFAPRRLDIACGSNKTPGYKGIDISPDAHADIVHDLFEFPWPIKANSVQEAMCSHFVEHIPHTDSRWPNAVDGFFLFFDEVYRILKKGGTITIIHPYVQSARAFWDPTHLRFVHEVTWYYLDPEWRTVQSLQHYPTISDFEIITVNGMGTSDEYQSRAQEQQTMQRNHYWNVVQDLQVVLKKR